MKKFVKKCAAVTAAITIAASMMMGCSQNTTIDGTATAATCNDETIPMGVASLFARYQQAQIYYTYSTYFGGVDMFDTEDEETGKTYGESTKDDLMETLETMYLMRQKAPDYDVTLTEEEQTAIDTAAEEFIAANDEETLTKIGCSKEDVATLLELYTYQNKMYDPMTADIDTEVSDEEAARTTVSYVQISLAGTETDEDGNTVELTDEEKAAKEAQAQEIIDKINATDDVANADMEALAQEVDETLTVLVRSYGADDETPDSAIKEAVEGVEDGTMVDHPILASDETVYYVVRLDAAFDREATDAAKETILSERRTERYNEVQEEWREEANFSVNNSQWNKISLTDNDVYTYKEIDTTVTSETVG